MRRLLLITVLALFPFFFTGIEQVNAVTAHEKISTRINHYVAESLSLAPSEIEISELKPANGAKHFFPGKITGIRPAKSEKLLGRVLFALTIQQAQQRPFVQWVLVDIAWIRAVVVVTQSLKRHHVIEQGDLKIQKIRVQNQDIPYATHQSPLLGKRLMRSLRTGRAIRTDHIEEAPVILRGDRIILSLQAGGLSISTTGLAKEDGLQGALIKVINLDSRKTVIAKVVGPGQVSVGSRVKD